MSNQKLINSLKEIAKRNREANIDYASARDSAQIFSSVALGLYNTLEGTHDEKVEQIITFLNEVQDIWEKALNNELDTCQMCYEVTGLQIGVKFRDEYENYMG